MIWKHRESEESIFKPNSAFHYKDKLYLAGSKDYSLKEVTAESVKIFSAPKTKWFFDNCTINIGIGSDKIVKRFQGKDGLSCRFWQYCKLHRDNGGRLTIYLLTTSNCLQTPQTDLAVLCTSNHALSNTTLKRKIPEKNVSANKSGKFCKESKDESLQVSNQKTSFQLNYKSIKFASPSIISKPSKSIVSPKSIQSSSFFLPLKSNKVSTTSKVFKKRDEATSSQVFPSHSQSSSVLPVKKVTMTSPHSKIVHESNVRVLLMTKLRHVALKLESLKYNRMSWTCSALF